MCVSAHTAESTPGAHTPLTTQHTRAQRMTQYGPHPPSTHARLRRSLARAPHPAYLSW